MSGVSDVGSLVCGEEIQFFEITSYFEFLPSQHPEFQTAVVRVGQNSNSTLCMLCVIQSSHTGVVVVGEKGNG